MIPRKQKQTFSNSRRQLASNAHELEEVTSFIQHILHGWDMKKILTQVYNTSLMFNMNHGQNENVANGLNNNPSRLPYDGIPQLCEPGDSIGQTKRYNGVCSRKQPRVRQHYVRWF